MLWETSCPGPADPRKWNSLASHTHAHRQGLDGEGVKLGSQDIPTFGLLIQRGFQMLHETLPL